MHDRGRPLIAVVGKRPLPMHEGDPLILDGPPMHAGPMQDGPGHRIFSTTSQLTRSYNRIYIHLYSFIFLYGRFVQDRGDIYIYIYARSPAGLPSGSQSSPSSFAARVTLGTVCTRAGNADVLSHPVCFDSCLGTFIYIVRLCSYGSPPFPECNDIYSGRTSEKPPRSNLVEDASLLQATVRMAESNLSSSPADSF